MRRNQSWCFEHKPSIRKSQKNIYITERQYLKFRSPVWPQLSLSLPRVINVKFPPQLHQKYYITQYEEFGFSSLTQMKDDYTTNSHYPTYTFLFRKVGRMYLFQLGSERVMGNADYQTSPVFLLHVSRGRSCQIFVSWSTIIQPQSGVFYSKKPLWKKNYSSVITKWVHIIHNTMFMLLWLHWVKLQWWQIR